MEINGQVAEESRDTYPDLEAEIRALEIPGVDSLRSGAEFVIEASAKIPHGPHLPVRFIRGTLMLDSELSTPARVVQRVIFKSVRRRFHVGELPASHPIDEAGLESVQSRAYHSTRYGHSL